MPGFKLKTCPLKQPSAIVGGNSNACVQAECVFWITLAEAGKVTGGNCAIPLASVALMNLDLTVRSATAQQVPPVPQAKG